MQVLCHDQVHRLHQVMATTIPIHGRGNFPTLDVNLKDFIRIVRDKLAADSVKVMCVLVACACSVTWYIGLRLL